MPQISDDYTSGGTRQRPPASSNTRDGKIRRVKKPDKDTVAPTPVIPKTPERVEFGSSRSREEPEKKGMVGTSSTPLPYQQRAQSYTELKPFWQTDEFKQFVKDVREGKNTRGVPATEKLPETKEWTSTDLYKSGHVNAQALESQVRQEVKGDISYVPPGATKEDVQKFIDTTVKDKMSMFTPPRYIFLSNGMPVYLNKEEERKAYLQTIQDKPWHERFWLQLKYDVPNTIMDTIMAVAEPSLKTKELLTDDDPTNWLGPLVQSGYNTAILGWEYVRSGVSMLASEKGLKDLQAQRDALILKGATPGNNIALKQLESQIEGVQSSLNFQKASASRIALAQQAVMNAWAKYQDSREYLRTHPEVSQALAARGPAGMQMRLEYFAKLAEQEEQAKATAESLRFQSDTAYASGDFTKALELTKLALNEDRRANPVDPYGAYTW